MKQRPGKRQAVIFHDMLTNDKYLLWREDNRLSWRDYLRGSIWKLSERSPLFARLYHRASFYLFKRRLRARVHATLRDVGQPPGE